MKKLEQVIEQLNFLVSLYQNTIDNNKKEYGELAEKLLKIDGADIDKYRDDFDELDRAYNRIFDYENFIRDIKSIILLAEN